MRAAHPYEEPAFDVIPWPRCPPAPGWAASPNCPSRNLARLHRSRGALAPATAWGVRAAGDPDRPVRRVAVCGGAGDSLLSTVARAGVDVYVTADLRHHPPTSTAAAPRWPWSTSRTGPASNRGAIRPPRCWLATSAMRWPCARRPSAPTLESARATGEARMKADATQQRALLELAQLDAELTRIVTSRRQPAWEQQRCDEPEAQQRVVADRVAVLAWRSRISRVRCSGWNRRSTGAPAGGPRPCPAGFTRHERQAARRTAARTETLQRRQSALEDSEPRSWSAASSCRPSRPVNSRASRRSPGSSTPPCTPATRRWPDRTGPRYRHGAAHRVGVGCRPLTWPPLYDRAGAGALQGALRRLPNRDRPGRRAVPDRGRCRRRRCAARNAAQFCCASRGLVRDGGCVKVIVEADGGSRGNPGPAGYGAVVLAADRATVLASANRPSGWRPTTSPNTAA